MSLCSCVKIFPHRAVSAQRWLDSMAGLIKWRNASFQNVASPQSQFSSSVSHEVNIAQRILCGAQWKWWWVSEWREKSKKAPSLSLLQSLSLTGHPLGIESVTLKENKLAKLRKHPSRVNFGSKKFGPQSPNPSLPAQCLFLDLLSVIRSCSWCCRDMSWSVVTDYVMVDFFAWQPVWQVGWVWWRASCAALPTLQGDPTLSPLSASNARHLLTNTEHCNTRCIKDISPLWPLRTSEILKRKKYLNQTPTPNEVK